MAKEPYPPFKSWEAQEAFYKVYDETAKQWPLPSDTRMIPTSYGETFVRISGPAGAPPLVLLHGQGANSLVWIGQIAELSQDNQTFAVDDIYDMGRSVFRKRMSGVEDYMNWLNEVFAALRLQDGISVVGVSYGGWQAGQYALRFPGRLKKVVLCAPAATVLPVSWSFIIRVSLNALPLKYFFVSFMRWIFEDFRKGNPDYADALIDRLYEGVCCFKQKSPPAPTVISDAEWQKYQVPTLFIIGDHEKIYPCRKALQRLQKVAPNMQTAVIEGAGHDLMMLEPAKINRLILDFLKE